MTIFTKSLFKKRSLKNDREFNKTLETWRKMLPTFSTFRAIIESIKELEIYFMYDNSSESSIYTPVKKGSDPSNNIVFDFDDMIISVRLEVMKDIEEIQEITNINIKRKQGLGIETKLRYENDNADKYVHSPEDMMLYGIVEYRIANSFCNLIEHYYYNGPHREIDPSLLNYID